MECIGRWRRMRFGKKIRIKEIVKGNLWLMVIAMRQKVGKE